MKNSTDECYQTDKMGVNQYSGRQNRRNQSGGKKKTKKKPQKDKRMKNTKEMVRDIEDTVRQSQLIVLYKVGMYKTDFKDQLANHKIGQTSTLPDNIPQIYVICDVVKPEILCLTTLKFAFHTLKAERQILGSLLIDSLLYSVIGISLTYRLRIVSYFTMMRCVAILSGMNQLQK